MSSQLSAHNNPPLTQHTLLNTALEPSSHHNRFQPGVNRSLAPLGQATPRARAPDRVGTVATGARPPRRSLFGQVPESNEKMTARRTSDLVTPAQQQQPQQQGRAFHHGDHPTTGLLSSSNERYGDNGDIHLQVSLSVDFHSKQSTGVEFKLSLISLYS